MQARKCTSKLKHVIFRSICLLLKSTSFAIVNIVTKIKMNQLLKHLKKKYVKQRRNFLLHLPWNFDSRGNQRLWLARQVQNAGHRSQVTGHRSQVTGHRSPVTGHRSQVTGHRSQITGHRSQVTGHRLQKMQQKVRHCWAFYVYLFVSFPVTSQSGICLALTMLPVVLRVKERCFCPRRNLDWGWNGKIASWMQKATWQKKRVSRQENNSCWQVILKSVPLKRWKII